MHSAKLKTMCSADKDFAMQIYQNYASSKADFISKMQIALKECHETEYWLKLFVKTNIINEPVYSKLSNDSGKIRRILISSINTAKANQ